MRFIVNEPVLDETDQMLTTKHTLSYICYKRLVNGGSAAHTNR